MELWGNNSLNQLIYLNMDSSCGNTTTYCLSKVSCTDEPGPEYLRRPSFSWFCQSHRKVALKGCHNEVGHLGLEYMLDLMHDRFYWPHMAAQAKEHIRMCCPCLAFKAKQPKFPLENIMVTHPLELVHLNHLYPGLEENVVVVTDHLTRYAQAYVTSTQTVQTTARTQWDRFIVHYGLPEKILSDQGCSFKVSWWLTSVS